MLDRTRSGGLESPVCADTGTDGRQWTWGGGDCEGCRGKLANVGGGRALCAVYGPTHRHRVDVGPNGEDEFFLVTEGELTIEFEDAERVTLRVNDSVVIPARVVHRTRPAGRAVNLLVEPKNTATEFRDSRRRVTATVRRRKALSLPNHFLFISLFTQHSALR